MSHHLYVAGVGASAGGLEALTEFFANLPQTLSEHIAFVVAQHLSPNYRSMLVQILAKDAVFPVIEAENEQIIKAGTIYITPPDFDIQVNQGAIYLSKPRNSSGPKPCVDMLLQSLAEAYGAHSVAIILSGTGSDGAQGVQAIKSKGGYAIIQNPDSAKYDGMPLAALQTGIIDYSLPPEKIGLKLEEIIFNKTHQVIELGKNPDLQQIFQLLYQRFGTNFSNYKASTILRRIDKQRRQLKLKDITEYTAYLKQNTAALQPLYESFLINVTSFFRDEEAYHVLEQSLQTKLQKCKHENIRVWIPGCSTGEEVYSIAMLLQHIIDQHQLNCNIQIFATDIDENALNIARKGIYSEEAVRKVPRTFVEKYMIKHEKTYEIDKNLRSKILFSKHDITSNPPFLKIDLLCCRNVLIYLNNDIQRQIFPVFHYALKEDGLLFLGKSESVTQVEDLFDVVSAKFKIFKKRKFSLVNPTLKFSAFKPIGITDEWDKKRNKNAFQSYKSRLFETFADITQHAYIVVNPLMDIIETKGNLSDFMQIPEGLLNLNINKLLRKEVQTEVKNLLLQVIKTKQKAQTPLRKVVIGDKKLFIKIQCGAVIKDSNGEGDELYLIVFEKYDLEDEISKIFPTQQIADTQEYLRLRELEDELSITKEHLQTYIEELETTNEELQSLNEELQSANEELQSANEELETSNEELQSSNEELQTAYAEIKHINNELLKKEQEISSANLLFTALFENTQQGNILVTQDFTIHIINATAQRLLEAIGISNGSQNKNFIELLPESWTDKVVNAIVRAQRNNQMTKEMLKITYGEQIFYYEFCFTPVRPLFEPKWQYIAVGILDMSDIKKREEEIFLRDEMLASLLQSSTHYLIRTDLEGRYTYVNEAFCQKFGFSLEQLLGKHYAPTVHAEDIKLCENAIAELFENPDKIVTVEIRKPNPAGGYFYTEWEFILIRNKKGEVVEVQGVGRDITSHRLALLELEEERNQLEMMIWGGRLGTWDWNLETGVIRFNERWAEMLGYDLEEANHFSIEDWQQLIHPEDRSRVMQAIQENIQGNTAFYEVEHRKKTKNGEWKWIVATGKVIERNKKGKAIKIIGIHQDITDRKKAEEATKISDSRNAAVLATMQEGIVIQDMDGKIISCNHSAEEILGLTLDQMLGRTSIDPRWRAIKENGEPFPGEEHPAMQTIKTGKPLHNVMMGVHKPNGELTWILVNSQLLYYPDTKIPYAVFVLFHDVTDRKKVENELAKTLERLHLIGANFPNGSISLVNSQDLTFLYTGGADYEKFNVNPDELIGKRIQDVLIPEVYQPIQALLPSVLQGQQKNFEVLFNGHAYMGTLKPILSKQGTVDNFIILATNITERKNMENDLRRTKEMLEQTSQIARVGGWEIQADTLTITWSDTVAQILETDNRQPDLPSIFERYKNPYYRKLVQDCLEKALQEAKNFDIEVQIHTYKDREIWLHIVGVVECNEQGKVKRVYGALTDVTAAKKAQEELARLSMVAQKTSNAVMITDADKKIIWANEAFSKITGYELNEVLGKTPKMFQFEGTDPQTVAMVDKKLQEKKEFRFEILNKGKYGRVYWLDIEIQPIIDAQGNLQGYMAIETDITDRKQAQQERDNFVHVVQHQNERLREYTHITSHNLRAPVANLKGLLQLLEADAENQQKYLEMIKASVFRLDETLHLMNDLLDIESQAKTIPKTWIDIQTAVQHNCDSIRNMIQEPVEFIYQIANGLQIKAIPVYLDSILNNLISNAIKYHKNNETAIITITAAQNEKNTWIQVKDNGIGIDIPKYGHKLFKLKSRLAQNVEGQGVGLFFAKHQAESMGGTITVESQPNVGSTFTLILPNV